MSIASAITAAQGKVAACYTAISNAGGTLPATQNLSNMPTAIGSIPSGGTISPLTVTPSTSQQTITASGGVDGYSPITVNAVSSSIDANITASNIKSGVSILGVTGSVVELNGQTLTVTPRTYAQTLYPQSPSNAITEVTVGAVSSSIDSNIQAGNIKDGVTILGVTGNYTGGSSPTLITKTIISNGTYAASSDNADGYSSVTVNVSGGGGYSELPSYQVSNGVASRRSGALTGHEFDGITSVGDYGLYSSFYDCEGLTGSVIFSNVTDIGMYGLSQTFRSCTGISSASFPLLKTVDTSGLYHAFSYDSSITSVDFSSLEEIESNGFSNTFRSCTGLTIVRFPALKYLYQGFVDTFYGCTALTDVYFNALTTNSLGSVNEFANMLRSTGTSVTHTLHFPSNMTTVIQSLPNYPLFGGTSGYVTLAFDLPATDGGGSSN